MAQAQQQPTGDRWKTYEVQCRGGLNTSEDTLSYQPGEATKLINYEPGVFGGYRRISGYAKYDTNAVPGTGKILGVAAWNGNPGGVIACRQNDVYFGSGSGWTTHINGATARTGAGRYTFNKYYYGGKKTVVMCDGVNFAGRWDGTTYTLINGVGAPTNPKFSTFFAGCLVLAGYTSGGGVSAISISSPTSDVDFNGVDGAIEILTSDAVTGVRTFRDVLYIFCQRSILSLSGTNASNFVLDYVATGIGCTCYDSLQEVNGDLVYLAEDGIRTLSGTMKLNDVELGTISKPILNIANQIDRSIGNNVDNVSSVVIREKNQYRLFYNTPGQANADALGIIGAIRPGKQQMTQFGTYISVWEWGTLLGIRPVCCDSDMNGIKEIVVHGMDDGFVYQQEIGGNFGGANITSIYTTAPLPFDDAELRKMIQKVTLYYRTEGLTSIQGQVLYDFDAPDVLQPTPFTINQSSGATLYGTGVYGTDTYGSSTVQPRVTNNTQGSGKTIQLQFTTNDMNPSHSIQGITFQYRLLGRR